MDRLESELNWRYERCVKLKKEIEHCNNNEPFIVPRQLTKELIEHLMWFEDHNYQQEILAIIFRFII